MNQSVVIEAPGRWGRGMIVAFAGAALAAGACGGGGDERPRDAGSQEDSASGPDGAPGDSSVPEDSGTPRDSGAPVDIPPAPVPNAVVGRSFSRCTSLAGGTSIKPGNLAVATIQALRADAGVRGGFRVATGSGKADGTFQIDNVPEGVEFMLRVGRAYYVTSSRVLDIHDNRAQRCDPAPVAAAGDPIMRLVVSNMTPFRNSAGVFDSIDVHSFNLMYQGGIDGGIDEGATALATNYFWTIAGSQFAGDPVPLLDAAAGDDLLVTHVRSENVFDELDRVHGVTRIVDRFQPSNVTLVDRTTTEVTGAFAPAGNPAKLTLAVSRGQFDGGFDGTTAFTTLNVTLMLNPIANDFGTGARLAGATFHDWSHSTSRSASVEVNYNDPFPTTWSRTVQVDYVRTRRLMLPETTVSAATRSHSQRILVYAGGNPVLTPTLPPPLNIKVAGADFSAGGMVPFDGIDPVMVSWNGVATADVYVLVVSRVFRDGPRTETTGVASFTTAGTSVQIPADVLSGGQFFAFELRAIRAPSSYASGELNENGPPLELTEIPSGMFRFSATCGDDVVDTGEGCDAGGASDACDVDCTLPVCGDGLRNALAGEACDAGQDTESCDRDCTPPACGDGHVNGQLEDCDDGDTQGGVNCTADCKFPRP